MKNTITFMTVVFMTAMILTSCGGDSKQPNTGSIIHEVTIGKQVWMTQNLNVDKFLNGDTIPEAKSDGEWRAYSQAGEAAWCYCDNDPKSKEKYGKFYNWYAVNDPRGLAPKGWRIPSDTDYTVLIPYLHGLKKAGAKMKSKEGWLNGGNGTNSSGFSGLPGGYRDSDGPFRYTDSLGYWWSSAEYDSGTAWGFGLSSFDGEVFRYNSDKELGMSVRCLRD
jgi:uncharacterized protein (TIGR02145 family)